MVGAWGQRWQSDITSVLGQRERIASDYGLAATGGHALLWLLPWSGTDALALQSLDPLYIEICRRVRLAPQDASKPMSLAAKWHALPPKTATASPVMLGHPSKPPRPKP